MLGRKVGAAIAERGPESLVAEDVVGVAREADLLVLNLECCISERGERWPDPGKPFFFRAPPAATETLRRLGVSCVTLANNHALDFGAEALLDTFEHLRAAGIDWVGAAPIASGRVRTCCWRATGCGCRLLRPSGGVRGRSGLAWNRVRARVASAGDKASGCGRGARDAALGPEHGA